MAACWDLGRRGGRCGLGEWEKPDSSIRFGHHLLGSIIYDPTKKDNEKLSAEKFALFAEEANLVGLLMDFCHPRILCNCLWILPPRPRS